MAIFANSYVLKVELPYSEYWLPLIIGMGVGLCAITMGRLAFGRKNLGSKRAPATTPAPGPPVQGDPFTLGSPSEQRKSFRRQGNPTAVHIALPEHKDQPSQGWVLDRSMGGICLQASEKFNPGTLLAVLPVNAPCMTPWVDIEVRTCRDLKDGYELGCQFIKTPNWSVLLMFG